MSHFFLTNNVLNATFFLTNNSAKILIIFEKEAIVWRKVEKKYLYADGTDYADRTACQDCHPLD